MSDNATEGQSSPSLGRRKIIWGASGVAVGAIASSVLSKRETVQSPNPRQPSEDQALRDELERVKRALEEERRREEGRKQAQLILSAPVWTGIDLNAFLNGLSEDELLGVRKALVDSASVQALGSREEEVRDVQKNLLRRSKNIAELPFLDADNIQYHEIVKWVANKLGVHDEVIKSQSTFVIERAICERLFADMWNRLGQNQRSLLLKKIDPQGSIKDHAAIVSLGGSAAIAVLSGATFFTGFAFYTSMSVAISTAASMLGLTLPFAAYTGASSVVAFLTGPIGWAVAAVAAVSGVVIAGRANVKQTAAAVTQIHCLKVAALKKVEYVPNDLFVVVGRVFRN